ncbi:PulJ/GspJ family protein [Fontivita pretiosa]|uniref:PulJ/GspJ family protein n=1 Tax=Fontivita pretiosa TaxID=2989684 RepID=UPI003D165C46
MGHSASLIRHVLRHGFTFVELCLGLVITSLVMSALAAFALAMSSAWKQAEQTQSATVIANQVSAVLQDQIRQARLLGAWRAGSINGSGENAAVMLWKEAAGGDGIIQDTELSLIEFDPTGHRLLIYPAGQGSGLNIQYSAFTTTAVIDNFKVGRTARPLARGIWGASFKVSGTGSGQVPRLQFALRIVPEQRDDNGSVSPDGRARPLIQYGQATLRAPAAIPSF